MRVERISWAKWLTVALAVGLIIAWLHATLGQTTIVQSQAQVQFLNLLNRRPVSGSDGKEYPWIKSVTVYPAVEVVQTYAKSGNRKAPVTYLMLTPATTKGAWQYVGKSSLIDDPIELGGRGPEPLTAYLAAVTKDRPFTTFRYAFWDEPRWIYGLWVGGSVLVIGIIWPIVLRRLVAAGYGGQPDDDEPSLWQRMFARKPKPTEGAEDGIASTVAKPSPTSLSEDDMQKIAAMEEKLAGFGQEAREPGGEVEDEAEPAVKKLVAGPLETASQPEKKEEPREYAGEFYPTATHVPKKK